MIQSSEYQFVEYLKWYWRTKDFRQVMRRRTLDETRAAKLLYYAISVGFYCQIFASVALIIYAAFNDNFSFLGIGLGVIFFTPVIWAFLVAVPLLFGRWILVSPGNKKLISEAEKIFKNHPATKIAILGSYGKTSMKELLGQVLSSGLKVAKTPGNKNVAISHAHFAKKLKGDEDILIIEYGEGQPGDIANFSKNTHPDIAIITGIAPAHLDKYKTIETAAKDIMDIATYIQPSDIFVNQDSELVKKFAPKGVNYYSSSGVGTAHLKNHKIEIEGSEFEYIDGKTMLKIKTGLIGKHNIGAAGLTIHLGLKFGIEDKLILNSLKAARAYDHRMQVRNMHGAWIIDDTYNGNIEGMRAGLELLNHLSAERKIYITPGLVDQGEENESIHTELGRLIASAHPDIVVLMNNSVTKTITNSLSDHGYNGEVKIEANPLRLYSNLDHFVARGDIVLMQNDWTDNYN
ncbi:MAG: Mur ligase family protein [Patescibacteria group bacterium]